MQALSDHLPRSSVRNKVGAASASPRTDGWRKKGPPVRNFKYSRQKDTQTEGWSLFIPPGEEQVEWARGGMGWLRAPAPSASSRVTGNPEARFLPGAASESKSRRQEGRPSACTSSGRLCPCQNWEIPPTPVRKAEMTLSVTHSCLMKAGRKPGKSKLQVQNVQTLGFPVERR